MKRIFVLYLIAFSAIFASCGSDDDTWGDWMKGVQYGGVPRVGAVGFTIDNITYVGLGLNNDNNIYNELKDFWKFDGSAWVRIADFPGEGRHNAVAFVVDGKAYVGSGYRSSTNVVEEKYYKDFWKYDPATDQWSQIQDLPGIARESAVAFSYKGKGYMGTGKASKSEVLQDFYSYDGNQWQTVVFGGDKRFGASSFVLDGAAYVFSGINMSSQSALSDLWKFDGEKWERMTVLRDISHHSFDDDYAKIPRYGAATFIAKRDGKDYAYIAGGTNGSTLRTCFEYNATTDRWDEVTELPAVVTYVTQAIGFSYETPNMTYGYIVTGGSSYNYPGLDGCWKFDPNIEEDEDNDY